MDLRSLSYFVETVRLNSFTQAADTMNVTQSTISKMVRHLEDEVGAPLLIRHGRKLVLTETGRVVFARGEEMLASMRQLRHEVRDTQNLQQGNLTIGMPPMVNLLFTDVLKAFRQRYPNLTLTLREDTGQSIERQVAAGDLEIGLTLLPTAPELHLQSEPVRRYPIWAAAEVGTFRASHGIIALSALKDLPLVMLTDNFALARGLHAAFAKAGFTPQIAAQSGQWDWLVSMASAGVGVALLPEPFVARLASVKLDVVRVVEPAVDWQVAHVWHPHYLSRAARAWLEVSRRLHQVRENGMES